MKSITRVLTLLFLLGFAISNDAWADRGRTHAHVGVYFGAPLFSPWHYPAPYYGPYYPYYQTPIIVTSPPPVYIERGSEPAPGDSSNVWHYCSNPDGYYPYIKECPGGWQKVKP